MPRENTKFFSKYVYTIIEWQGPIIVCDNITHASLVTGISIPTLRKHLLISDHYANSRFQVVRSKYYK